MSASSTSYDCPIHGEPSPELVEEIKEKGLRDGDCVGCWVAIVSRLMDARMAELQAAPGTDYPLKGNL